MLGRSMFPGGRGSGDRNVNVEEALTREVRTAW